MRWDVALLGVLVSLALAGSASAQPADSPSSLGQPSTPSAGAEAAKTVELPDTLAGRALGKFLSAIADPKVELGEGDFDPLFIKKVPLAQVRRIVSDVRAGHGALDVVSVESDGDDLVTALVVGRTSGQEFRIPTSVDKQGRIRGLFLHPGANRSIPALKGFDELDTRMGDLCQSPAVAVARLVKDDEMMFVHRLNADVPLAVGSTFKLYVLSAVAEAVKAGTLTWDTPVVIRDALKSLPSGVMQNEPEGKTFTVREMAEGMISISDNTATDHLLFQVGREAVERELRKFNSKPEKSLPFLSTREMFQVKLSGDLERAQRYADADEAARRKMIAEGGEIATAKANIVLAAAWRRPVLIDSVEWFVSTEDACRVMAHLYKQSREPGLEPLRAILSKNPGLPLDKKAWAWGGYKGGSEPGVLNLTWVLETTATPPEVYLVSVTFNDTKRAVAEDKALGLVQRALGLVGQQAAKPEPAKTAP